MLLRYAFDTKTVQHQKTAHATLLRHAETRYTPPYYAMPLIFLRQRRRHFACRYLMLRFAAFDVTSWRTSHIAMVITRIHDNTTGVGA